MEERVYPPEGLPVYRIKAARIPDQGSQIFPEHFILVFDAQLNPIGMINHYTLNKGVGRRVDYKAWKNTQKSYADDLANWAMACHFNGTDVLNATRSDIRNYSATLQGAKSRKTGRAYARASKSRRVGTVVELYKFGYRMGWIDTPVVAFNETPSDLDDADVLLHPAALSDPTSLLLSSEAPGEKVSFIPPEHQISILAQLGPDTSDMDVAPSRDRTATEWAATTGMREDEVTNLTLFDILNLDRKRRGTNRQVLELKISGKGQKPRAVEVTITLLDVTLRYIETTRAATIDRMRVRGIKRKAASALFLSLPTANNRDLGRGLSPDTLSRVFSRAVRVSGLTIGELRYQFGEDGDPIVVNGEHVQIEHQVPMYTFHDECHTFAINTYVALKYRGDTAPWKKVQLSLGHAHMQTTVDIYGKHVPFYEAEITELLVAKVRSYDRGARHG